jgi:hypothetical protein
MDEDRMEIRVTAMASSIQLKLMKYDYYSPSDMNALALVTAKRLHT